MAKPHRYLKNRVLQSRDVGKVLPLILPGLRRSSSAPRWITEQRADGRFLARSPKMGVLLRDLDKKRGRDYGPARLLAKGTRGPSGPPAVAGPAGRKRPYSPMTRATATIFGVKAGRRSGL